MSAELAVLQRMPPVMPPPTWGFGGCEGAIRGNDTLWRGALVLPPFDLQEKTNTVEPQSPYEIASHPKMKTNRQVRQER
jgi:hypothetical protein